MFANFSEHHFHFTICADGDAHEAWADVLGSWPNENALTLNLAEQCRTAGPKIGEQKITGAGIADNTKFLQRSGE